MKVKILIVEHDPVDLDLLHHELKISGINYESEVVQTEVDYIKALNIFIPDIILSDYTFPSFNGPTAFMIRERITPDVPFIFVTGTIGEEKSTEFIKNGVTDYVLKDKLFTLSFKVNRALKESETRKQKNKTEQELIANERLLARSQQVAHMGNWEWDFSGDTVHCSAETCRIYGIDPDQNIQTREMGLRFIHPEDVASVIEKINECRKLQIDIFLNYRIIHTNGSVRHIYSEGKLEFNSNGEATGLYGIVHDVTATVLLENKLIMERHEKQSEITAAVLTAQEKERASIGNELHENLNQVLSVTKLYIEMAKTDEKNRAILLDKSVGYIVNVIGEIRKISKMLGSPRKHMGLYSSIKNLLDDLLIVHPIEIQFHGNDLDEATMNEKVQVTIFRIVQEQVTNILSHSKATFANINLTRNAGEIQLVISDNGIGTDFLKEPRGVGIKNIKSRVDLFNGIVTIISEPGKGYKLNVLLPLPND